MTALKSTETSMLWAEFNTLTRRAKPEQTTFNGHAPTRREFNNLFTNCYRIFRENL